NAAEKELRSPADYIIIAIGQRIESDQLEKGGIETSHGALKADLSGYVPGTPNVFAGGDAVTGPATVIRAVAAGKVGAANIDAFLDYNHTIRCDVEIPPARLSRSEEHTSELQSRFDLVCRLLLEKKKKRHIAADSNL